MAIFKCKMCGGDINAIDGAVFGSCDSCGITSTFPKANDEKLVNLFNRANHIRRLNDFDKALTAYENVLNEDNTNAEAHWCVALCRYGIEYVEDPRTHERVPTCHRTQYTSILKDTDYLAALEYAEDNYTRTLYEAEAIKINEIQKRILAISNREEPFDVFICYKETTDGGSRTKDSTLAQEIYYQLTNEGYRVFFSKITLEEKLGQEYEPYIFAALNSAKVMLVVGTKKEHFEAVWVKNEWSRFLSLMKGDHSRLLIPCYRNMDAYDMPDELAMLQSQDMSKIGFIQDLIRGIKKVLDANETTAERSVSRKSANNDNDTEYIDPKIEPLMKRAYIFLEDKDYERALEYFKNVLEIETEYTPAYIGKMCAAWKTKIKNMDKMMDAYRHLISDKNDFRQVVRFDKMLSGHLHLEKCLWQDADRFFEEVLDGDPEFAPAYIGKLMTELQMEKIPYLSEADRFSKPLTEYHNYNRAIKFADTQYRAYLSGINNNIVGYLAKKREEARQKAETERLNKERFKTEIQRRQEELASSLGTTDKKIQEQAAAWHNEGLCPFCGNKVGLLGNCKACKKAVESFIWLDAPENAIRYCGYNWIVLEVENGRALLLSHRIIEKKPYNQKWDDYVTWETCDVRKYLNGEFYNQLMKSNDWKGVRIAQTKLSNKANPWFDKKDTNPTNDKIFLLSLHEVVKYFGDSGHLTEGLSASYSEIKDRYNKNRRAYTLNRTHACWWLRSPGRIGGTVTYVDFEGEINMLGENADDENTCLRPALWIEIEI